MTSLSLVSPAQCQSEFNSLELELLPSQLCARGLGGEDSCEGDSGGPLITRQPYGPSVLTGIISFGTLSCDSSLPGVYTDVSFFYDWILQAVQTQPRQ